MKDEVPNHVVIHVRETMGVVCYEDRIDKPWWTLNTNVIFSTRSLGIYSGKEKMKKRISK